MQPAGPGYRVAGNHVTWENWDFRVGFNGREGLLLHMVGYTQNGRRRPVLYRASIAEMVVPYGTPERSHYRKNVFDSGELGFGRMANSLTLGCDCLGTIHYFDAVVPNLFGAPRTIENAVCLHEEDAGLAWKHFDVRSGRTEVRRARKLVISSISTIGNYEYASYWYLHQDGRIEYEMKATGIINTAGCHPGQPGKYGSEVAPGILGHIHQHIFCARLDMDVDGSANTVVECDTIARRRTGEPVRQRVLCRGTTADDGKRSAARQSISRTCATGRSSIRRPGTGSASRPPTSWRPGPRSSLHRSR